MSLPYLKPNHMLNMHNLIISTCKSQTNSRLFFSFVVSFFFFISFSTLPVNAQDSLEGIPQSAFYNNEIILTYKEGFTPEEIQQKVAIREERSETLSGSIHNTQENVSLFLAGEDRPEKVQEIIESVIQEHALEEILTETTSSSTHIYTITSDSSMDQVIKDAATLPVEHVQPNYTYYLLDAPNDSYFGNQWGFNAIHADKAWERAKGSTSSVSYTHLDVYKRQAWKLIVSSSFAKSLRVLRAEYQSS